MSEPGPKRTTANDDAPYELIYWPGLPGRGEFIRLVFEDAGVKYTDHSKGDNAVPTVLGLMSPENVGDATNPPIFASPALRHGNLLLNQTASILLYLAPKLGLAPADGNEIFHLNSIVLTILDGLCNEVHETHHPTATSLTYEEQKPEAKKRAKAFTSERLPKYLTYVQRVLDAKTSDGGPWLYGNEATYADLVLFQALDGTTYAFPKTLANLKRSGKYNGVFKLYDAVKERPNIKTYLASDRRCKYDNGIYRHYPELEED